MIDCFTSGLTIIFQKHQQFHLHISVHSHPYGPTLTPMYQYICGIHMSGKKLPSYTKLFSSPWDSFYTKFSRYIFSITTYFMSFSIFLSHRSILFITHPSSLIIL